MVRPNLICSCSASVSKLSATTKWEIIVVNFNQNRLILVGLILLNLQVGMADASGSLGDTIPKVSAAGLNIIESLNKAGYSGNLQSDATNAANSYVREMQPGIPANTPDSALQTLYPDQFAIGFGGFIDNQVAIAAGLDLLSVTDFINNWTTSFGPEGTYAQAIEAVETALGTSGAGIGKYTLDPADGYANHLDYMIKNNITSSSAVAQLNTETRPLGTLPKTPTGGSGDTPGNPGGGTGGPGTGTGSGSGVNPGNLPPDSSAYDLQMKTLTDMKPSFEVMQFMAQSSAKLLTSVNDAIAQLDKSSSTYAADLAELQAQKAQYESQLDAEADYWKGVDPDGPPIVE